MLKNELLWRLLGGVATLPFLMVFGIWTPRDAQEAPRGAQRSPEPPQVPTFDDFGSILGGICCDFGYFWVVQGVPKTENLKPKTSHPKSRAPNPTPKLQKKSIPKFGQHSPSDQATKVNIKLLGSIPPAFEECQGACRYLLLPEYHES